ncbi:MAG: two-component system response regulator [Desulfococcus sp. 4484_242]|nr:MAG: two-component system response regulator [Desulfococcus sp. 4484_242]
MKIRVLLVDDEKDFVDALAERLSMRNYDVTVALRGEEALDKLRQYNFDVVILDVRMPGIDGNEVLSEIKRIKPLTEVIMLTGHATVESAIEGMKQGAYDYLIKPCETEDLVTKINRAYEKKAEHEERIREAKVKEIISSPRAALKDA